jgi:hypothetical protein
VKLEFDGLVFEGGPYFNPIDDIWLKYGHIWSWWSWWWWRRW